MESPLTEFVTRGEIMAELRTIDAKLTAMTQLFEHRLQGDIERTARIHTLEKRVSDLALVQSRAEGAILLLRWLVATAVAAGLPGTVWALVSLVR